MPSTTRQVHLSPHPHLLIVGSLLLVVGVCWQQQGLPRAAGQVVADQGAVLVGGQPPVTNEHTCALGAGVRRPHGRADGTRGRARGFDCGLEAGARATEFHAPPPGAAVTGPPEAKLTATLSVVSEFHSTFNSLRRNR